MKSTFVFLSAVVACSLAQRSPYAGTKPIGYPELEASTADPLINKFGEGGTTEKLPIEALGDRDLVNRISKLPIDQQPFWYINWKALEEHRKNPQSYPQKETPFIEQNQGSWNQNGQGAVPQGNLPQQGFPQRFPQNGQGIIPGERPQESLPQPQAENRLGVMNKNLNSATHSQLNFKPQNPKRSTISQGDIDHIQGMPVIAGNIPNKTALSNGDIDQFVGVPHNDGKRNIHYSQNQGKKAVQDFSKYFMPRV